MTRGQYKEAERHARGVLRSAETAYGDSSLEVASAIDQLASALLKSGGAAEPESRALIERAVRIKAQRLGTSDVGYALSLQRLGAILVSSGSSSEARSVLKEAVRIQERSADSLSLSGSLIWLGAAELEAGDPDAAPDLMRRALEIRRSSLGANDPGVGEALNSLAGALYATGEFAEASRLYEETLQARIASLGPTHPATATCLHNLAAVENETGDYAQARSHAQRAVRIRRSTLGDGHYLVASSLNLLGESRRFLGDRAGARSAYAEAIEIWKSTMGPRSQEAAWSLMKLGLLDLDSGKTKSAESRLEEAKSIQEEVLGSEHPDLAWTLGGLAKLAEQRGDTTAARGFMERTLHIQESAYGPMHPDVGLALSDYAAFLARTGNRTAALDSALRACALGREHIRLTTRGFSERQALAYVSSRPYGLDVALAIAGAGGLTPHEVERVWDALIRSRAIVLDEIAIRQRVTDVAEENPSIRAAADSLELARRDLAKLLVQGSGGRSGYERQVADTRSRMEQAERVLASRSVSYLRAAHGQERGWKQVVDALPPDAALVGFARYGTSTPRAGYVAFVATSTRPSVAVPLGSAAAIDSLVGEWVMLSSSDPRGSGRDAEARCRKVGAKLRRATWDRFASAVAGASRVLLVSDGSLYRVNLAALPLEGGGFLVEEGPTLHHLPTERDLAAAEVPGTRSQELLAVGGPDFGNPPAPKTNRSSRAVVSSCVDLSSVQFDSLPASLSEAEEVVQTWGSRGTSTLLTGRNATEAAFKRNAPGKRVLHVATHGFFIGTDCGLGARGGRGIGKTVPKVNTPADRTFGRALQLSGLVFAGANRRQAATSSDEGILTAQEIASLDLSGVEWAVLSACDTGRGEIQAGEGVLGLRRAFQIAGVGTTIMSLWNIEDRSARDWMRALYQSRILRSQPTADAVRNASVEVLRERRAHALSTHPFYWAAFVAAGDWN